MTIQYIKLGELEDFVRSPSFQQASVIPISTQRALAQARNPGAREEDVVLVLAYDSDQLMGYLGLLPDSLYTHGKPQPIAWMSCIWVSPAARGKGVAKRLLRAADKQWTSRLLATEFTGPARQLYDKMKLFDDLQSLNGMRAYLRPNLSFLLPKKHAFWRTSRFLLKGFDLVLTPFNKLRMYAYKRSIPPEYRWEKVEQLDAPTAAWLKTQQEAELFARDASSINWMLNHPWLANDEQAVKDQSRYAFSVYAQHFSMPCMKLYHKKQLAGLIILALRDRHLKIPYLYVSEEHIRGLVALLEQYLLEQAVDMLTTYHPALCQYWQKRSPFYHKRPFIRQYLISQSLSRRVSQAFKIQDGDGDCAFT